MKTTAAMHLWTACVCFVILRETTGELVRIGNQLQGSTGGVSVPGATFLIQDMNFSDGILFAFSAFFRAQTLVKLQVWGPPTTDSTTAPADLTDDSMSYYKLKAEVVVMPSVVNAQEDVYIASRLTEPCVRVRPGDVMGVYFEEAPGAIAYTFDPSSPAALVYKNDNVSNAIKIDEEVGFSPLTFPYDFALAAYIDTNLSRYDDSARPSCIPDLVIPSEEIVTVPTTPPTPPPTGAPGATGAAGPQGGTGPQGAVGPQGATGVEGPTGTDGQVGPVGPMGATGAVGATGMTGQEGRMGSSGATGRRGEKGETGARGEQGPPGPLATGLPNQAPVTEDDSFFSNPLLVLILLVWAIVVTIVLIIVIVVVVVVCRRSKSKSETPTWSAPEFRTALERTKSDKRDSSYADNSWMNTLNGQSQTDMYVDKVDASGRSRVEDQVYMTSELEHSGSELSSVAACGSLADLVSPADEAKNY